MFCQDCFCLQNYPLQDSCFFAAYVGNGVCDDLANTEACSFDGGKGTTILLWVIDFCFEWVTTWYGSAPRRAMPCRAAALLTQNNKAAHIFLLIFNQGTAVVLIQRLMKIAKFANACTILGNWCLLPKLFHNTNVLTSQVQPWVMGIVMTN